MSLLSNSPEVPATPSGISPIGAHGAPTTDLAPFAESDIEFSEHPVLMKWLNHGLRAGKLRQLESEFPHLMNSENLRNHVVMRRDGQFAAHCLIQIASVTAGDRDLDVGMIGMVYTDPAFRGRGLASACLEKGLSKIEKSKASLALLWSDLDRFYGRLGFDRAGIERFYLIDRALCSRALRAASPIDRVRPARTSDWPHLEALHASKTPHCRRPSGFLAQLSESPDCRFLVAELNGIPVAYAAMGRGDDLARTVHEWAGTSDGLIACLSILLDSDEEITLLEGPVKESATRGLRGAGAASGRGSLGLLKILDIETIWSSVCGRARGLSGMRLSEHPSAPGTFLFSTPSQEIDLSHRSALSFLFGPSMPRSLLVALSIEERERLRTYLPYPLFMWGFDSI